MKNKLHYLIALFALPFAASASIAISGTALQNVDGLSGGDYGILLVDTSGSAFDAAALASINQGLDLSSGASFGSNYYVAGTNSAASVFGSISLGFSTGTFDIVGASAVASAGDSFAVLTFDGSSSTSVGGTTYEIWTDAGWTLPNDGAAETFGGLYTKYTSGSAGATGTVAVPEPSTYATLAGLLALGFVMLRRRG
jgi:hypothetical protein